MLSLVARISRRHSTTNSSKSLIYKITHQQENDRTYSQENNNNNNNKNDNKKRKEQTNKTMSINESGSTSGRKYIPPFLRKQLMEEATVSQSSRVGFSRGTNVDDGNGAVTSGGIYGGFRTRSNWATNEPITRGGAYGSSRRGSYGRDGLFGGRDAYVRHEDNEESLFKDSINAGINFDNYDNIPVETFGKNCPEPIETFESANLPPLLMNNLERAKFTKPTPVQKYSIPIVAQGRDLMACAQTGSGKTGGFLFPMIMTILNKGVSKPTEQDMSGYYTKCVPTALVLAPTRELCTQIYDESRKFLFKTGLRSVCVYGGADIRYQIQQLSYGCEILVATPGRLVDLIDRGHVSLSGIQFLTLDEADRMLDMGFEQQIRYIVEKTGMPEAGKRTTLMFSATFPKQIQSLARDFLHDYIFLTVGRVGSTTDDITQQFEFCEEHNKRELLLQHVSKSRDGLLLIFSATKQNADELEEFLIQNGYRATSIHGDKTQRERESALKQFKKGITPILVATDVASRGLDIPNVQHVINYDLPENIDDYVHRIGRTGRAGNKGLTTAFFTEKNRNIASDMIKLLREAKQSVPSLLLKANEEARLLKFDKRKGKANGTPFGYKGSSYGGSRGYDRSEGGAPRYGSSRGRFGAGRGGSHSNGYRSREYDF
jgi:ATP-dependent RNA helicase DDX3X